MEQEIQQPKPSQEPVKLDIFQHLRIGVKNREDNCFCENDLNKLYYCIPCKNSCCDNCSIQEHASHLLIQKEKFFLNPPQINNSFKSIEEMLDNNDLFKNIQQKRTELINEIDITSSKSNFTLNGKEKESKNNVSNNNMVHSIMVIFNPKYLNGNANDGYSLINIAYNKIDLSNLFKHAHQNIEKISINKCFEEFTKVQTLDENNLYKCPKCKENIAARNKIELYKIPKILLIQLKRFENGQKIKTFIDFPIKNLDISSFISNSSQHYSTPTIKYDLFAVSNHYGELEYGHYNATCLNYTNKHWYNFNDKKVEIISDDNPDSIVTKDAYVLFYRQRKMENIDWEHIYNKQYKDIKDDNYLENININEIKNNNNLKNNFIIKSGIIELDEEEDEKEIEQDSLVDEEISLDGFVYNPFKDSYLKLKRRRLNEK